MRKIILVVITIVVALIVYVNVNAEEIIIPSSAIRFRVIANSNSIDDQKMKVLVKEYIDDYLSVNMLGVDDVDGARNIIKNNMDDLNNGINKIFDYLNAFILQVKHYFNFVSLLEFV